jgi:hypothetical protein
LVAHEVFINYRGVDTYAYPALLHNDLSHHFGDDAVFLDSASIEAGADFVETLLSRVRRCKVLLAVIGTTWLTTEGPGGRLIDDPADWVHRELVEAFAAGVRIIPVLTDQAKLPTPADLPTDLAALANCQARPLRHRESSTDLQQLRADVIAHAGLRLQTRHQGRVDLPPSAEAVNERALANAVVTFCTPEYRGLSHPYSIPIAWKTAAPMRADHWRNIRRDGEDEPLNLDAIADQANPDALRRVVEDSALIGRVVILGERGSGKTGLLVDLTRELAQETVGTPSSSLSTNAAVLKIPLLLRLATWNPDERPLEDWLADRQVHDYNHLDPVPADRILPIFDGLDEMPRRNRSRAITAINNFYLADQPFVLASRPDEYEEALNDCGSVPMRAAVLEIQSLRPEDVREYLIRCTAPLRGRIWESAFSQDGREGGRMTRVLSSAPLWANLARIVCSDPDRPKANPERLLQLTHDEDIQSYLLDHFIPAVYPDPPGSARHGRTRRRADAQRWLGLLAWTMQRRGSPDLDWSKLIEDVPRAVRVATGLVPALIFGLVTGIPLTLLFGPAVGLIVGSFYGLAVGTLTGFIVGFMPTAPARRRDRREPLPFRWRGATTFGPLVSTVVWVVTRNVLDGFSAFVATALTWIVFGICFWFAGDYFEEKPEVGSVVTPQTLLDQDRSWTLGFGRDFGIPAGLGATLLFTWLGSKSYGNTPGVIFGLAVGVCFALGAVPVVSFVVGAWSRYQVARIWLSLTGQLPWALLGFLADAQQRGVLRQHGGSYQFSHALLRDRIAETWPAHQK